MNATEIMKAALCEAGYPRLAGYVEERAGRRLVMFNIPIDERMNEAEARAVHRARTIAYDAIGIPTDELLSEDDYVRVAMQARSHIET